MKHLMNRLTRPAVALFLVAVGVDIGLHLRSQPSPNHTRVTEAYAAGIPPRSRAAELSDSFALIAQEVTPAVVNVNTLQQVRRRSLFDDPFFRDFFGDGGLFPDWPGGSQTVQSLGSGVIVSPDGLVITNHHVVENADQITVSLADKREFAATLAGSDPFTDVAVLRMTGKQLPTVKWGNSDALRVGDWVVAVGSPYGLSQTVTAGIVSAKGRKDIGISGYEDFIQTDAAINQGNSGGALVDVEGRLVGINTAIISSSGGYDGIGFAIPSNLVRPLTKEIVAKGRVDRGWIGVFVRPVTAQVARRLNMDTTRGVVVYQLYEESPAYRAGVRPADVILAVNGVEVDSVSQVRNAIAQTRSGRLLKLRILRQGRTLDIAVLASERPKDRRGRPLGGL